MPNSATYTEMLSGLESHEEREVTPNAALFEALGQGQSPKVALVTCSDSRIDPCAMTGTKPGDIFVIRNAGNIVPPSTGGELASLEFAIFGLKVEHIVVCGHSQCGAMKGLMNPDSCASLSHVSAWVKHAGDALKVLESDDSGDTLAKVTEENVRLQMRNLMELDFVKQGIEAGSLQVHGWVYDVGTGKTEVLAE